MSLRTVSIFTVAYRSLCCIYMQVSAIIRCFGVFELDKSISRLYVIYPFFLALFSTTIMS